MGLFFGQFKKAITYDVLTPLYNTIGIQHDFSGATTANLKVRMNGAQQEDMYYNPEDTKHYWTGWLPENTAAAIEITDHLGDTRTASTTSLTTAATKPPETRMRFVSPDVAYGAGDLSDSGNPGDLRTATEGGLTSGDEIELAEGTKPYYNGDLSIGSGKNNITLIAKSGETPIWSGAREASQTWVDQEITSDDSTGAHTGSSDVELLTDSAASWTVDELIGRTIVNTGDVPNSSGVITDNTATTITADLQGGTNNSWTAPDTYVIDRLIGVYALSDHDTDMHQVHAEISGTIQRIEKYDSVADLDDAFHGWAMNLPNHGAAGEHEGDNQPALIDNIATWNTNELIGLTVTNTTKGESATITANTGTVVTGTLSGGADWDDGNNYTITPSKLFVKLSSSTSSTVTVVPTTSIMYLPKTFKKLLTTSGDGLWIEGIIFEHVGAGVLGDASGVRVGGTSTGIRIKDCIFRHCSFVGLNIANCTDVLVDGCSVLNGIQYMTSANIKSGPEGSELASRIGLDGCTNATIRNCTCNGGMDQMSVIDVSSSGFEINVHDNTFTIGVGETLDIRGTQINLRRWGNTFSSCQRGLGFAVLDNGPVKCVNEKYYDGGYLLPIDLAAGTPLAYQSASKFHATAEQKIGQLHIRNCTFEAVLNTFSDYTSGQAWRVDEDVPMSSASCINTIWVTTGQPFYDANDSSSTFGASVYNVWDHNHYFTENGFGITTTLWRFDKNTYAPDFAGFQADSGLDANSAYGDPNLTSGVPSPAIAGTWIPGITGNATLGVTLPNKGAQ